MVQHHTNRKWKESGKSISSLKSHKKVGQGLNQERKTLSLARIGELSPIDQHRLWLRNTELKVYGLLRHSPMGIQKEKQNLSLRPFPPPHYQTKTGESSFRMRSEEYLLRVERLGSIWVFGMVHWVRGWSPLSLKKGKGMVGSYSTPKDVQRSAISDAASTCSSSPGEGHRRVNVVG